MSYLTAFCIWYAFGVIFHVLHTRKKYNEVLVSSLLTSLLCGILGMLVPLALLLFIIVDGIDGLYLKYKDKKIF
jgi:uncharacterized membrane protein